MAVRLLRNGENVNISELHYAIDEGSIFPTNPLDENGNIITKIITGSDLIEVLDAGGINTYIFSEKSNSWKLI
jgi:hypothetical protein